MSDSDTVPDDLLTIPLAQKLAREHASQVYEWIEEGKLKTYTVTSSTGLKQVNRVSRAELNTLLAEINGDRAPDKPTPIPPTRPTPAPKPPTPKPTPRPQQTAQREGGGGGVDPADLGFNINEAIGATEATKFLRGKRGRSPHRESVRRWMIHGCVVNGEKIFLRSVVWSGERLTMKSWIEDFIRRRTQLGFKLGGAVPRGVREQRNATAWARLEVENNSKPKSKE